MSEAFLTEIAQGVHQARSAGTTPADRVHPQVVAAMREVGIDLSARIPRKLTNQLAAWADVVVTMGCGDHCPYIPGRRYIEWDLPDPKGGRFVMCAVSEMRFNARSKTSWLSCRHPEQSGLRLLRKGAVAKAPETRVASSRSSAQ